MTEKDLYDELFNSTPDPRNEKREENKDLLSNLFNMQINTGGGQQSDKKKKKKDEEVHEYIKLAEKSNDKAKKSVQKWKEEQTLTTEQIRQKRQFEKITSQFEKTKKSATSTQANKKKEYLPNIINPFEKPEKKVEKAKGVIEPPKPAPTLTKKLVEKPKEKEAVRPEKEKRVNKVEQKEEKIARKEEASAIPSKPKEAVKPQIKKEPSKQDKQPERQKKPPKKKQSSSSSSSPSGSSSSGSDSEPYDWRKELRQITKYNPSDKKFKQRDQYVIKQSGIDRMFGEDRFSSRMGRLQQQEDMIRQMRMKHKKEHKKDRH